MQNSTAYEGAPKQKIMAICRRDINSCRRCVLVDGRERSGASIRYSASGRGSVIRSVTATGTVNPVIVVQVGTYDSGPIIAIYADFNSPVKAGQLIAKIDPRPFQVKVDESAATLANAQAQLGKDQADMAYKQVTFERNQRLFQAEAVS